MNKKITVNGVIRSYYTASDECVCCEGNHQSYSGVLHDEKDNQEGIDLNEIFKQFDDGAEIVITVEDKGTRFEGEWNLVRPGIYERG